MAEHLNLTADPQSAIEYAYPRWQAWHVPEKGQWWAAVRTNLTKGEVAAGCEPFQAAETPGELALLLDAEDQKAGVSRTPVRIVAWGSDDEHVSRAYSQFALHSARPVWKVTGARSTTGELCPWSISDPKAILAHAGDGWAYALYPVVA